MKPISLCYLLRAKNRIWGGVSSCPLSAASIIAVLPRPCCFDPENSTGLETSNGGVFNKNQVVILENNDSLLEPWTKKIAYPTTTTTTTTTTRTRKYISITSFTKATGNSKSCWKEDLLEIEINSATFGYWTRDTESLK